MLSVRGMGGELTKRGFAREFTHRSTPRSRFFFHRFLLSLRMTQLRSRFSSGVVPGHPAEMTTADVEKGGGVKQEKVVLGTLRGHPGYIA